MRAVLINPHTRDIVYVDDHFGQATVLRQYLAQGSRGPLTAPPCLGPPIDTMHHTYVDDLGCYREGQAWFRFAGVAAPVPGHTLILGHSIDGSDLSVAANIDWLTSLRMLVEWVSPEDARRAFPPIVVTTIERGRRNRQEFPIDWSRREPYQGAP